MSFIERYEKTTPYSNDYDETKDYLLALFKGGVTLQPRELSFVQTMLQDQIGRFGDHIFKNGSPVKGAESNITVENDTGIRSVVLTPGIIYFEKRFLRINNDEDTVDGKYTFNVANGQYNFGTDPVSNLVGILSPDSTTITVNDSTIFPESGVVLINDEIIKYTTNENNILGGLTRGYLSTIAATHAFNPEVRVLPQREGKKKDDTAFTFTYNGKSTTAYNENPSDDDQYGTWFNANNFLVGIKIEKSIVTSKEDSSLLDNSKGKPNSKAPGSDRLKVKLSLDVRPLNQEYSDFIRLIEYKNGEKVKRVATAQYSDILKYFARSYDEIFGNFSVIPHKLSLTDWSIAEINADDNRSDGFCLNISPGKTYVSGYQREFLANTKITIDNNRNSLSTPFNNTVQNVFYDYFDVDLSTTPGPIPLDKIFVYTIDVGSPAPTFRAWVRQVARVGSYYRIYYSDASPGFTQNFKTGLAIAFYDSEDPSSLGSSVSEGVIQTAISFSTGKQLNYNIIPNAVNFKDLTAYIKVYQSSVISGGGSPGATAVLDNVLAGETDPSSGSQYQLTSPTPGENTFVIDNSGNVYTTGFTLNQSGGGINQIEWSATPPVADYRVYYKSNAYGSDTIGLEVTELRDTNNSLTMSTPTADKSIDVDQLIGGSPIYFDVYKINSVTDGSGTVYKENVDYILLTGITSKYYYASGIRWIRNRKRPTGNYTLDYNYWNHQGSSGSSANGSFIVPDSFKNSAGSESAYELIPNNRHGILDFRTRNNQVSITDDKWTIGNNALNTYDIRKRTRRPITNFIFAIDHQRYLARYDVVYIDKDGLFKVNQGEPKANPDKPMYPPNALLLAHLYVPAYPRKASNITIFPWKSQRYTQQDLRLLEERISSLERITLNNKLELLALNQKLNPSDTLRGVLVDDFSGHGVADVNNPEYDAGIDPETGSLRLPFEYQHYDLNLKKATAGPNIRFNENTVTLDFNEEIYIENRYATGSDNVNPFDVFTWLGVLKVSPSQDQWTNTNGQPSIIEDSDLRNSHFDGDNPVKGWDREFNFAQRILWGQNADSIRPNTRFASKGRSTIKDSQVEGSPAVPDRGDGSVEAELRASDVAWSSKLIRKNGLDSD